MDAQGERIPDEQDEEPVCDIYRVAISPEMRSKSKVRPPTASSDGDESRRWRMISERPRDAAIRLVVQNANGVVRPGTIVVHLDDASIGYGVVVGARRLVGGAAVAPALCS